jgi:hypothetical protein
VRAGRLLRVGLVDVSTAAQKTTPTLDLCKRERATGPGDAQGRSAPRPYQHAPPGAPKQAGCTVWGALELTMGGCGCGSSQGNLFGLVRIMGLQLDELYDVHAGCGAICGSGGGGGKGRRAEPVPVPHDRWMTLLGYAAFLGEHKIVSALLKAGADPTVRSAVRTEGVSLPAVACLARAHLRSVRHILILLVSCRSLYFSRPTVTEHRPGLRSPSFGMSPCTGGGVRARRQRAHAPCRRQAHAHRRCDARASGHRHVVGVRGGHHA